MKHTLIIFLLLFSYFVTADLTYASDKESENETSEEQGEKDSQISRDISSFADFFREQTKSAFKGVILCNVISIEEDYLYIKPKEKGLGRMYVYLDKDTEYSTMNAGKRKKGKKEQIIEGQRIAARVIIKEGIILADEIFLVEGDFEPLSRYRKRVFKAPAKKEGEAAEKGKEGGHGESKPADKKSGGH